jgi:hypothetical protein
VHRLPNSDTIPVREQPAVRKPWVHPNPCYTLTISALEDKVKQHDADDSIEESRITLKGKPFKNDNIEKEKWKKQIDNHKK